MDHSAEKSTVDIHPVENEEITTPLDIVNDVINNSVDTSVRRESKNHVTAFLETFESLLNFERIINGFNHTTK